MSTSAPLAGIISKSYGLGAANGSIAARDAALRDAVSMLKDYTTICASAPSELLTALALRNRRVLLDRNLAIVQRNLPLLDGFFERHAGTFDSGYGRPPARSASPGCEGLQRRRPVLRAARRGRACPAPPGLGL